MSDAIEEISLEDQAAPKRTRRRIVDEIDIDDVQKRIHSIYQTASDLKEAENRILLNRYAKYRMWVQPKDDPWPDCSNVALPDMMEKGQSVQDTLVNAVMNQSPPIEAESRLPGDKEKEDQVTRLTDSQFFIENDGEAFVEDAAQSFACD
ncbi:MAG: hypothetical protein MJA83_06080, partial [Gammaproteobacteria bacterium]|nr:hypothetical protein [Gammaproteobacteria bacterium]